VIKRGKEKTLPLFGKEKTKEDKKPHESVS